VSKSKGDRYERRLVNLLDAAGFVVMRSPSSGSATEREQPDVYAARDGERYAFEVKYLGQGEDYTYLDGEEIEALEEFARVADAIPLVVGRWWRKPTFRLYFGRELPETDGGNYRLDRDVPPIEVLSDGGGGLDADDLRRREVIP